MLSIRVHQWLKNGRYLLPIQTQRGHVADQGERKRFHGDAIGGVVSRIRDQRVAEASSNYDLRFTICEGAWDAPQGEAGFCFSKGAGGGVCGWVFLAWVSALLSAAEAECEVLAGEGCGEPGAGSAGDAAVAQAGLERVPDLGVSVEEVAGGLCAADLADADQGVRLKD